MFRTHYLKIAILMIAIALVALFLYNPKPKPVLTSVVASDEVVEVLAQPVTKLPQQMKSILDHPKLHGGIVGISVRRADNGKILYSHNGVTRLRPASNMKLVTGTSALNVLGPNYRFSTVVSTDGSIKEGVLYGNLYIKGKGDPTLSKADLDQFAVTLKEKGILKIDGNLIADDSWYDSVRYSQDLNWSDEHNYVGAQVSALTLSPNGDYDAGTVLLEVTAGGKVGERPNLTVIPATDYVEIVNQAKVVGAGGTNSLNVEREHGSNRIIVTGQMPIGAKKVRSWVAVWEPTGLVLDVFQKSLAAQGIQFTANSGIKFGHTPKNATVFASKDSIPLEKLFLPFMKLSNNGHAELLVKEMGKVRHGEGSWEAGLAVMKEQMKEIGLNTDSISLRDGSGMSHKNLISSDDLTSLLFAAKAKPWFPQFKSALPIAGEPDRMIGGTLRNRLSTGPALGNVVAKTGSITGVSTLSGYVTAKDGTELIFSVLINNFVDGPVTPIEDAIVEVLAEYVVE